MTDWPFGDFKTFSYDLILADPAWLFKLRSAKGEAKSAQAKYRCMTIDEITNLPVGHLAAKDCVLLLCATNPMLDQAFGVMAAWGFRFVTAGTWIKLTTHEKLGFGTGYILRSANEPFLIGCNGTPPFDANNVRSVAAGTREHSRKPDVLFDHAELLVPPGARKVELFSREGRPGWDVWGDQAGMFDKGAAA